MNRILITGGYGFLGSHLCDWYINKSYDIIDATEANTVRSNVVYRFHSKDYNLLNQSNIYNLLKETNPNIIIHLAATVGGIGANRLKPGQYFYDNLMMGTLLLEQARNFGIPKVVAIGTVCAYPKYTPAPFKESDIWNGYPEETNAPYGLAKKMLLVQAQAYRQQYGSNFIYLLPVNLYGPRDNFDEKSSHVIPAIIKKCIDARDTNQKYITCWGTGKATREFLYVKDAAEAIALAAEKYNDPEPMNIGSGYEITINDLTNLISKLTKFNGDIKWDPNQPDGQPRRLLDVSKAKTHLNFTANTTFEHGLTETIKWYESHRNSSTNW